MRPHLIRTFAALAGCALLLALTARAEPPQKDRADETPCTGQADPDLAPFDAAMRRILREHHVPGGEAAVAKNGKIVYDRGFGYADEEDEQPVEPDSLFRIASLTKPITAVAVLHLVERGKLRLDDKVFDVLQLQAPEDPKVKFDERWKDVTVLHLLQHRGGWDRDKSGDPLFQSARIVRELKTDPPADPDAIVRWTLRRPLDFDPGERYVYSNFGYLLLGRVIEKATGKHYADYVKKEILTPLGIGHMRQGRTLLGDRAPGEVHYYCDGTGRAVFGPRLGQPVPWPYGGWSLESLDSVGAWVAPADDLVRFASAFDDPDHCKVLSAESIKTMFARPPGAAGEDDKGKPSPSYYACGWWVRPEGDGRMNVWHNGSLDGSSTQLVRRSDGVTFAVLFNSRQTAKAHEPADAADALMNEAADEVKHWPGGE